MKGTKGVAVLDVQVPAQGPEREEWEERGLRWYRCDVACREEVEKVKARIEEEVRNFFLLSPSSPHLFSTANPPHQSSSQPTPPSS